MPDNGNKIGNQGEDLAAKLLEDKGWLIIDRNYFFEKAEVDIVATDGTFIIFAEVKTRSGTYFGEPEDFVTPEKERNIKRAAEAWTYERKMETALIRFDVISVVLKAGTDPQIRHFEDAFR